MIKSLTVFKYSLPVLNIRAAHISTVLLPKNAQPLKVEVHKGDLCLWALVDHQEPLMIEYRFVLMATGQTTEFIAHEIKETETIQYLNTVFLLSTQMVYHIFQIV